MEASYLHSIVNTLYHHPHWGGAVTFFIAFIESLAVVGTVIPGSVTMTAVGILVGSGIFPLINTILLATSGALCGDLLSYWAGRYFNADLFRFWPFTKYPGLIEKGENFFARHGGKSVIIGRFFGPARSLVPLIAGMLQMPLVLFLLAASFSALAWAIVYLAPGVFIGALALELPPKVAAKFIITILVIIAIAWGLIWGIHAFIKHTWVRIDQKLASTWEWLLRHHKSSWLPRMLYNKRAPRNHRQLALLFLAGVCFFIYAVILGNIISHGWATALNKPLYYFMMSLHTHTLTSVMLLFTILTEKVVMLGSALLVFIYLLFKRHWWASLHWGGLIFVTAALTKAHKVFIHSARPGGLLHGPLTHSFPSGHVILGTVFFGFLAVLIATEVKNHYRRIPYFVAVFLVGIAGISRLYLGAHWLTDVLGSLFLGLFLTLITTISYRRRNDHFAPKLFSIAVGVITLACFLVFTLVQYKTFHYNYRAFNPIHRVTLNSWWHQSDEHDWPLYRVTRIGKPIQILNIQWLGHLDSIKTDLTKQGWQSYPTRFNNIKNTLVRLTSKQTKTDLPLLPQLYNNKTPALLMMKAHNKRNMVLRLWKSNTTIRGVKLPLWIGTIYFQVPSHDWMSLKELQPQFETAINPLKSELKGYHIRIEKIKNTDEMDIMHVLHSDGKIMLVKPMNVHVQQPLPF